MSERPAAYPSLRLAPEPAPEKPRRAKCDRDVKLHISEAVYEDLARVARADQRPVSETIRVLLERHLYGAARAGG